MLRILLGNVQMFLSVVGVVLLVQTGLNPTTLAITVVAGATTALSRLLFRNVDSRI